MALKEIPDDFSAGGDKTPNRDTHIHPRLSGGTKIPFQPWGLCCQAR